MLLRLPRLGVYPTTQQVVVFVGQLSHYASSASLLVLPIFFMIFITTLLSFCHFLMVTSLSLANFQASALKDYFYIDKMLRSQYFLSVSR